MTIFHHEGFETRCAGTVAEALAALITRPDFVVLDLHLPDGRGTQVLREIRERKILAKVAVTTGTIDASLIGAADRLQPDKFFQKPYRATDLVAWIRSSSPSRPLPNNNSAPRPEHLSRRPIPLTLPISLRSPSLQGETCIFALPATP